MITVFLIIGIVLLNVTVMLSLKKGVLNLGASAFSFSRILELLPQIFLNGYILSSLILLGISFILWLSLLSKAQLSVAYPVTVSLNFVFLLIISRIFLKESLTPLQIIGIGILVIGVFLVLKNHGG